MKLCKFLKNEEKALKFVIFVQVYKSLACCKMPTACKRFHYQQIINWLFNRTSLAVAWTNQIV